MAVQQLGTAPSNASDAATKAYVDAAISAGGGGGGTGGAAVTDNGDGTFTTVSAAAAATRLDQFAAPTTSLSLNSQRITALGTPTASTDAATKAYVDSVAGGGSAAARTLTTGTAGYWGRFARVTITAVGGGLNALLNVLISPYSGQATIDQAEFKFRARQTAAFGSAPVVDMALEQAMGLSNTNIGYVVVQNTPTTLVDLYVQLPTAATYANIVPDDVAPSDTGASIQWINNDALATTTPSGLVTATLSTENVYGTITPQANIVMGGRQVTGLGTPVNTTDATTKAYVDANDVVWATPTPPVSWYATAGGQQSNVSGSALTSGTVNFTPFMVGQGSWTTDAIISRLVGAQSGGTVSLDVAIYANLAGLPDTSGNPLARAASTAVTLTTANTNIVQTLTSAFTLQANKTYWLASLYVASSAPTTAPTFIYVNNPSWGLAIPSSIGLGNMPRAYTWASRTVLPTGAALVASNLSVATANTVPMLYLRRSA
jgi:hypothetical protein